MLSVFVHLCLISTQVLSVYLNQHTDDAMVGGIVQPEQIKKETLLTFILHGLLYGQTQNFTKYLLLCFTKEIVMHAGLDRHDDTILISVNYPFKIQKKKGGPMQQQILN